MGKARDAASLIAAHRRGAKQRQSLVQEAEAAALRASRLSALVGAKVRVRVRARDRDRDRARARAKARAKARARARARG